MRTVYRSVEWPAIDTVVAGVAFCDTGADRAITQ
jgi:hypothetical protein